MRKNEPTAGDRVAVIPFYDADGALKSGLTFSAAGECAIWDVDSLAFTDTTNDPAEIGTSGQYYVQLTQPETNHSTLLKVRLRKVGYDDQYLDIPVTTFDLDDISSRLDTIDTTLAAIAADTSGTATAVELIQGLLHQNCVLNFTYTSSFLTIARIRQFSDATAANAATPTAVDDADGEIHRWRITAVNNGSGAPSSFKLVKEL